MPYYLWALPVPFFISFLYTKNTFLLLAGIIIASLGFAICLNNHQRTSIESRIQFYSSHTANAIAFVKDINLNEHLNKSAVTLEIKKLYSNNSSLKTSDTVILYMKKPYIKVDDLVYIKGLECSPIKNERIKEYLKKNNLAGTAFKIRKCKLIKRPFWSLTRFIHTIKNKTHLSLQKKLSGNTLHFFNSIFLGKKNSTQQYNMKPPFLSWGISHYLARSGLHLALVFFIATMVVNLLSIAFTLKIFIAMSFCILYAFLTWTAISFKRSLLLILGYQICHLLKVPIDSLHLSNLVLLTCVIANTQIIFFLDFQLTFILTYTLIIINKQRIINKEQAKSCA